MRSGDTLTSSRMITIFASDCIDFARDARLHSAPSAIRAKATDGQPVAGFTTCLKEDIVAFEDKSLTCRDCAGTFVFTAGEQGFYLEKGLLNEPQRCPTCRSTRRRDRTSGGTRELTTVTCAGCGGEASVPF